MTLRFTSFLVLCIAVVLAAAVFLFPYHAAAQCCAGGPCGACDVCAAFGGCYFQGLYEAYYEGYYQSYYQGYYEGYYQGYYQGYYEGYYQGYYQGGYYDEGYYQGGYYSEGYYQSSYAPSQPDLTTTTGVSPTTAVAGTGTTFKVTVKNQGTASTGVNFTSLLQKANDAAGTGATDVATAATAVLAAGASEFASIPYTFPAADGGTTKYLRICADKSSAADVSGVVNEGSNEGNNCSSPWTAITVYGSPTATLTATPSSGVVPGGSSNLTWASTNATSCTSPDFATGNATSNNVGVSTGALAATKTYNLSCTGPGGTANTSATVSVGCNDSGPVSVTATPSRIKSGVPTTVTFTTNISNASADCQLATGGTVVKTYTPNACTVSNDTTYAPTLTLTNQAVYKLTCPNNQTAQAVVNIIPKEVEF